LGVPLDVEMWNGIFKNPRAQKLTKITLPTRVLAPENPRG